MSNTGKIPPHTFSEAVLVNGKIHSLRYCKLKDGRTKIDFQNMRGNWQTLWIEQHDLAAVRNAVMNALTTTPPRSGEAKDE